MSAALMFLYSPRPCAPLHASVLFLIVAVAPKGWHSYVKTSFYHLQRRRWDHQQQFFSTGVRWVEAMSSRWVLGLQVSAFLLAVHHPGPVKHLLA
jgi:hypothetical protein